MKRAEDFIDKLKQSGALEDSFEFESISLTKSAAKTDSEKAVEQLFNRIESRAVLLLAIREHGAKELKTKLISKFPETEEMLMETQEPAGLFKRLIEDVIEHCQARDWQSDDRYMEQAVRSMMSKGQGPVKIRQKLQQACQNLSLISRYLDMDTEIWLEIATEVVLKKYGDLSRPTNRNEQAKRMRFLQSRGFTPEVIWKVFR